MPKPWVPPLHWPCFTKEINDKRAFCLDDGELLEADTVVVSIGDAPDTRFLGTDIATRNGFVHGQQFESDLG